MSTEQPSPNGKTTPVPRPAADSLPPPEIEAAAAESSLDVALERLLRVDAAIDPSSGFAQRVMASVRQEAATPAPIPFPWRQLVPGVALCAVLIACGAIVLLRTTGGGLAPTSLPSLSGPALGAAHAIALSLAALGLSGGLTWFSSRLMRG
jgi:hypothetical protein